MSKLNSDFDLCLDMVREHDRERYLSIAYAPEHSRAGLAALYAFQAEMERIPELVREPLAGEIRVQWWRDGIESSSTSTGAPVMDALNETIASFDLPRQTFFAALDARIAELYSDPFPSVNAVEGHAGETLSAIYQLGAQICLEQSIAATQAERSGHAGVAEYWMDALQNIRKHRMLKRVSIPAEWLEDEGLSPEIYLSEAMPMEKLSSIADRMAKEVERHYWAAVAGWLKLSPDNRCAVLPLVGKYVACKPLLLNPGQAVEAGNPTINPLKRWWIMYRASNGFLPT